MRYDTPNPHPTSRDQLAERFRLFATTEVEETSPLYHRLALAVANDADLLTLAATARAGQPPPNMLFAAVHFLLLQDPAYELAHYFPDLVETPRPRTEAAAIFRTFCLEHQAAITAQLRTRLVQTNELRRCAYLLPALSFVAALARKPLSLVEVGASAGLNLLFDRYTYSYNLGSAKVRAGAPHSPVEIDAGCHMQPGAELSLALPAIEHRIGLDLNPVDLTDEDAYRWLRALIWPEHADRVRRLERARRIWLEQPPALVRGDAVQELPALLGSASTETALVVFHTHVLNQFTPTAAAALEEIFLQFSSARTIYRVGNDLGGGTPKQYLLRLRVYHGGERVEQPLAYTDGHARSIVWVAGAGR